MTVKSLMIQKKNLLQHSQINHTPKEENKESKIVTNPEEIRNEMANK